MKKISVILILVFNNWFATAQRGYENLGEVLGMYNAIMGQNIIRGELGFSTGQITYQPVNDNIIDYTRAATVFSLDIAPNPEQHFHVRTQFYFDLNENENTPPYLSNLYYQVGWYDWHDRSISVGYENYAPNKFSETSNWGSNIKRGFVFASFNYDLLDRYSRLSIDETSQIRIVPVIRYSYEYPDRFGVETGGNHKFTLGTSVRWTIARNIYIESAAYYYPKKETKLPWDPDFTYGFGYFNWEAFKLNISYGNWIANRFPWNEKEMKHQFSNGELKVMFTWSL